MWTLDRARCATAGGALRATCASLPGIRREGYLPMEEERERKEPRGIPSGRDTRALNNGQNLIAKSHSYVAFRFPPGRLTSFISLRRAQPLVFTTA